MRFIETNMMLWFFISMLSIVLIRIFRPMMIIRDNLKHSDLRDQFKPTNFFLSPIYGEGFVFFMAVISGVSFLLFSLGLAKKIVAVINTLL